MSRVLGLREQRVQFFYDTQCLTTGVTTSADADNFVKTNASLFNNAKTGDLTRTNLLSGAGMFADDQTFLTFAVRHEVLFYEAAGESTVAASSTGGLANVPGSTLANWVISSSYFALVIGAKKEFEGPISMTPAGGGPWGFVSDSGKALVINGEPASSSIYVLPLPVAIAQRQTILMQEQKASFGEVDIAISMNDFEGGKLFRAYIDGYNTRDVQ